jgi:hypothetical protein
MDRYKPKKLNEVQSKVQYGLKFQNTLQLSKTQIVMWIATEIGKKLDNIKNF